MNFEEALSYINLGNCILFVGSGFSVGATNICGTSMVTGSNLAKILYDECNESSDGGNLQDASSLYIKLFGEGALVNRLKNWFTVRDYNDITNDQKFITSLPWKRVYTTNYDNIIELGYDYSGRKIYPTILSDNLVNSNDKRRLCIHLNGYIDSLDETSLDNEFKLTDQSYTSEGFVNSDWLTLFDSDLKTSDAIFFLGFSMNSDLDIKRVLNRDPETCQKCYFIVCNNEKKPVLRTLDIYGQALPINVDGFVKAYKNVTPKVVRLEERYRCFNVIKDLTIPIEIMDKDIHNLLTLGTLDINKIATSISFPDRKYYIDRTIISEIVARVEAGYRRLLIHSDIANGKTMVLFGVAIHLSRKKYNVYFYTGNSYNVDREVEKICTDSANNVIFIIDNYANNHGVIEAIRLFGQDSIVILSERSVINEVATEWLFPKLGDFMEFDVNSLTIKDREKIISLLNDFGFWREKAAYNVYKKNEYIAVRCKNKIRNILLDLFNSEAVISRFRSIISDIQNKQGYYEALLLMLIGKVFNIELDIDIVSTILGRDITNSRAFRKNATIAEFVNFENGRIIVRSSLLAEVILSKLSSTRTIVDLLIQVFKKLDKFRYNETYRQILISFLSYTNLQRLLNKNDPEYNDNIYRFFESVKTLGFCRENPHFWLQYAILVLASRDYSRADKYFKTAYSFAERKKEFETFAIDNHYARYILENELESGTSETCMKAFIKAHNILMDPVHKTKVRFYPYRVAKNYYPFYEKFYQTMSSTDKKKFIQSCREINSRAKEYAVNTESSRSKIDVRKAISLLDRIINEVSAEVSNQK